jgi:hypothetical protein
LDPRDYCRNPMALVTDRVPGMQPRTPLEELFPGEREAEITPMTTIKVGDVQPGAYVFRLDRC